MTIPVPGQFFDGGDISHIGMTAAAVFFGVADSHHSQFCQAVSVFHFIISQGKT